MGRVKGVQRRPEANFRCPSAGVPHLVLGDQIPCGSWILPGIWPVSIWHPLISTSSFRGIPVLSQPTRPFLWVPGIELGSLGSYNQHFSDWAIFSVMQAALAAHTCESSTQKVEAGESQGRAATHGGLVGFLRVLVPKDTERVFLCGTGSVCRPTWEAQGFT